MECKLGVFGRQHGVEGLAVVGHDLDHVVLSFLVRRNPFVLIHRAFTGVVSREGKFYVSLKPLKSQLRYFVPASMFDSGSLTSSQPNLFAVAGINCIRPWAPACESARV